MPNAGNMCDQFTIASGLLPIGQETGTRFLSQSCDMTYQFRTEALADITFHYSNENCFMYVILAIRYGSHRGVCGVRIWGITGYWSMGKQDERLWLTEEYDGQLECGTTTKGTSWQVSKQGHAHWGFGFVFGVKGFNLGVISSRWSVIVRVSVVRNRNFFAQWLTFRQPVR